jgi:hypothetical protein
MELGSSVLRSWLSARLVPISVPSLSFPRLRMCYPMCCMAPRPDRHIPKTRPLVGLMAIHFTGQRQPGHGQTCWVYGCVPPAPFAARSNCWAVAAAQLTLVSKSPVRESCIPGSVGSWKATTPGLPDGSQSFAF